MARFPLIFVPVILLQACSHLAAKADQADKSSRYFADATECFQTAQRKEKINVMMSGNTQHSFAFPIAVDIPVTYDAGAFKNCMIHAGHIENRVAVADATAFLELSKRCLDQARDEDNTNAAYADCIRTGDLSVDVFDSRKKSPLNKK